MPRIWAISSCKSFKNKGISKSESVFRFTFFYLSKHPSKPSARWEKPFRQTWRCQPYACLKTVPNRHDMTLITTNSKIFELQEGETLLEGLERTGHDVEYQCRSGYCGSCRVKILAGKVSYPEFPLAFVAPGEILPCCCKVEEPVRIDCNAPKENDLFERDLFDSE